MASVVFGRQVSREFVFGGRRQRRSGAPRSKVVLRRVGRYVWSLAPKADMELGEEVGNAVGFLGGIRG